MKENNQLLSVIIPAYRQEKTIIKDLRRIKEVLDKVRYDYEIIVVVDGFVDRTYERVVSTKLSKTKVYGLEVNHGKGYALRYGTARAKGDLIIFLDAGMEIDPNGISMVLEHMEWYKADIIIGSKRHPASIVGYPFQRRVMSFLYQLFVRLFTGLNVRDTQAGLKIFRRKVLQDVLPRLMVKRYTFDLEILLVARHLGYQRIFEAPIKLSYNFGDQTHAVTLRDIFKPNGLIFSLIDTLAIIYRLKIVRYYDDNNRRKWRYDPELDFNINTG